MSGSSVDYHLKFSAVFAANSQLHRLGIGPTVLPSVPRALKSLKVVYYTTIGRNELSGELQHTYNFSIKIRSNSPHGLDDMD